MKLLVFLFDVFGRARRRDFLLFLLVLTGVYSLLLGLPGVGHPSGQGHYDANWMLALLATDWRFILFIVLQLTTACVIIKRLHDRDLSGFWALAVLVPVLGWLWLAYELCVREGTDGPNRFGQSPKSGYRSLS